MSIRLIQGDVRAVLPTLPDASVHCVCTSPPYWGLRDYGVPGQLGVEADYREYIASMVAVFREVRRVLRGDGTCWVNLGDSYASHPGQRKTTDKVGAKQETNAGSNTIGSRSVESLKPKDLCGIPWRVAFALQDDGWWLRQDIVWAKPNPMPESVTDRCTKSHEYLFLLSKSERYYFDATAIAEEAAYPGDNRALRTDTRKDVDPFCMDGGSRFRTGNPTGDTRNKRSVWTITTQPFAQAHFATFPPALVEPCVLAGTSERGACAACGAPLVRATERTAMVLNRSDRTHEMGRTRSSGTMVAPPSSQTVGWDRTCACDAGTVPCTVLDPFAGAGTTGLVADRLQRNAILIELNPAYAAMARERIAGDAGLFASIAAE